MSEAWQSMAGWRHTVPLPESVSMMATADGIEVWAEAALAPEPVSELEAARHAAWQMAEVPYNPDAALLKQARKRGMGGPLTTEFDFVFQERTYRGQGFAMGIVFAEVGHWEQVWTVMW